MKRISETVIFFGSGPVAAQSLAFLSTLAPIEAVITKPKQPHHHGDVPVHRVAKELGIPLYTAENRATLDQLFAQQTFGSRVGILIDFGIIVSQRVIDYFPLGIINSHFSLLPKLRGADPISFAILTDQKVTGVSLMLLVAGMDEGPILAQASYKLTPDVTTPELTEALVALSDKLLAKVLPAYLASTIDPTPQSPSIEPTYSRKLAKDDGVINWSKPADQLAREVRGLLGWPGSHTSIGPTQVTVTRVRVVAQQGQPGSFVSGKHDLIVFCGKDALSIEALKPSGKAEMSVDAFLAGYQKQLAKATAF